MEDNTKEYGGSRKIYNEGYRAYQNGESQDSNPYDQLARECWDDGWSDGYDDEHGN